jgi:hypothetical protein
MRKLVIVQFTPIQFVLLQQIHQNHLLDVLIHELLMSINSVDFHSMLEYFKFLSIKIEIKIVIKVTTLLLFTK